MDRIDQIRVFAKVVEYQSYTKAAESLSLPKATVSQAIKDLESELKLRLLSRTTRRVILTQEGSEFLEDAQDLVQRFDKLLGKSHAKQTELEGRIRIDMSQGLARRLVVPQLPEFLKKYPKIRIELSSTDRLVDVLEEGFDCVLRVGNPRDSGLIGRKLGELKILNCASPEYLKNHGIPKQLRDLDNHQLIEFAPRLGQVTSGFEYLQKNTYRLYPMPSRLTVNSSDAYLSACLAGIGIIQAPSIGVRSHLKEGTLIEILEEFKAEPMPVTLLYPHKEYIPLRVNLFMNWLSSHLKESLQNKSFPES